MKSSLTSGNFLNTSASRQMWDRVTCCRKRAGLSIRSEPGSSPTSASHQLGGLALLMWTLWACLLHNGDDRGPSCPSFLLDIMDVKGWPYRVHKRGGVSHNCHPVLPCITRTSHDPGLRFFCMYGLFPSNTVTSNASPSLSGCRDLPFSGFLVNACGVMHPSPSSGACRMFSLSFFHFIFTSVLSCPVLALGLWEFAHIIPCWTLLLHGSLPLFILPSPALPLS